VPASFFDGAPPEDIVGFAFVRNLQTKIKKTNFPVEPRLGFTGDGTSQVTLRIVS